MRAQKHVETVPRPIDLALTPSRGRPHRHFHTFRRPIASKRAHDLVVIRFAGKGAILNDGSDLDGHSAAMASSIRRSGRYIPFAE